MCGTGRGSSCMTLGRSMCRRSRSRSRMARRRSARSSRSGRGIGWCMRLGVRTGGSGRVRGGVVRVRARLGVSFSGSDATAGAPPPALRGAGLPRVPLPVAYSASSCRRIPTAPRRPHPRSPRPRRRPTRHHPRMGRWPDLPRLPDRPHLHDLHTHALTTPSVPTRPAITPPPIRDPQLREPVGEGLPRQGLRPALDLPAVLDDPRIPPGHAFGEFRLPVFDLGAAFGEAAEESLTLTAHRLTRFSGFPGSSSRPAPGSPYV
jgi:hypothetical protein